jgi:hypothetical protein
MISKTFSVFFCNLLKAWFTESLSLILASSLAFRILKLGKDSALLIDWASRISSFIDDFRVVSFW